MNEKRLIEKSRKEIETLQKLESELQQKIKASPHGRMTVRKKKKTFQYYVNQKYVSKSHLGLPRQLAQRDYMKKLLPLVQKKIREQTELLRILENAGPGIDEVYRRLSPGRQQLVDPMIMLREDYIDKWSNVKYDQWAIGEETKGDFRTLRGERVRSKAEALIADRLTFHGVHYHYEYPLKVKKNEREITLRPDFMALNARTREVYTIEHLGMMDDPAYYGRAMKKISIYEENGYLLGLNLLLFHETKENPLNMTVLDKYIKEYLL